MSLYSANITMYEISSSALKRNQHKIAHQVKGMPSLPEEGTPLYNSQHIDRFAA